MMKRKLIRIYRAQRGITGLETAIILIAFVVVASVFAYTVLSAGLFSTEKSSEAVHSGLEESQSTLQLRGAVVAYADERETFSNADYNVDTSGDEDISAADSLAISSVEFMVTCCAGGQSVDLTPPFDDTTTFTTGTAEMPSASRSDSVCQITFSDSLSYIEDCAWTVEWVGEDSGDYILDPDEKAIITVYLHWKDSTFDAWDMGTDSSDPFIDSTSNIVQTNHTFMLEVKPGAGACLSIERTTPGYLDTTNDLS